MYMSKTVCEYAQNNIIFLYMLVDILKRINDAEEEADRILTRTKTQTADIEKDTFAAIQKLNSEMDAEIAAVTSKMRAQPTKAMEPIKIVPPEKKKTDAAIKYATEQFLAEYKSL